MFDSWGFYAGAFIGCVASAVFLYLRATRRNADSNTMVVYSLLGMTFMFVGMWSLIKLTTYLH